VAYIRKRGKTWQAIVRLEGFPPTSSSHPTKRHAELWAQQIEADMRSGRTSKFPPRTFGQALDRYALEVSATKRGARAEQLRLEAFKAANPALVSLQFSSVSTAHLAAWRDARLRVVSKGTVQREINTLRNVFSIGRLEWGWCGDNPFTALKMPGDNPARTVTWNWRQIRAMLRRLGYITGVGARTATPQLGLYFLLALHTGMRAGELHGMTRGDIDMQRRVVRLATHKTVEAVGVRHVPFSRRAAKVFEQLLAGAPESGPIALMSLATFDALFRKLKKQIGLEALHFHDARATFATLAARRVDPLTLAKVLGHKDMAQLISVYFRESSESMAKRL